MPAGRPTDYTEKLLAKAREYLATAKKKKDTYPSIAGLSLELGISRETCHVWAKDAEKQEFSDIYRELMALQELRLSEKGLTGEYNSTITKLMLTKHGYTDKTDVTSDGKALPTPILGNIENKDER